MSTASTIAERETAAASGRARTTGAQALVLGVVDDVRCEMALVLVERGDVSMLEIAFELGFSEPATLYRAFRRWTGTTPVEFRSRQSP